MQEDAPDEDTTHGAGPQASAGRHRGRRAPRIQRIFWLLTVTLLGLALITVISLVATEVVQRRATAELERAYSGLAQVDGIQKLLLTSHLAYSLERSRPEHPPFGVGADYFAEQLQVSMQEARRLVDRPEELELLTLLELQVGEDLALLAQVKADAAQDDVALLDASLERAMATADSLLVHHRQELAQANQKQSRWVRSASWLRIATALMLLVLAGAFLVIARRFMNAIGGLSHAIDQVKTGDLRWRAPPAPLSELQEVSEQFNQMTDQLAREGRERATFLSAVAHDLRTPLFALRSALQLQARESSPEGRRRRTAVIERQVDRMNRMVEDLLDAARLEGGSVELRRREGDLREVVSDCLQLFEGSSEKHVLTSELPTSPACASFDETRLAQVLVNLLSNAIKYSPDGGEVHVALGSTGDGWLRLSVRDHGVGMAPGEISRLFVPFRRFSPDARIPGAGLGLAVARRLVEAHGGRIEVESAPGEGSTFSVLLPELASSSWQKEEDALH